MKLKKHIYFKTNKTNLFKEKWKIFEETILTNIKLNKYVDKNCLFFFFFFFFSLINLIWCHY